MIFEFATAGRVLFGRGKSQRIPELVRDLGSRVMVVLGGSDRGRQALTERLSDARIRPVVFNVSGEPTTHLVDRATEIARAEGCDLVISVGGGSAIDAGKAVAVLLSNPGGVEDYLELGGRGKLLLERGVPFLAVPTTAGTGAEVTKNAVLEVPDQKLKVSLRSPLLLPLLAVVDPDLTLSLPPAMTAYTGMDALTQLIEPFVSNAANPLTDGVCREGLTRAARSLVRAYRDGSDVAAREDMALAALFGGLALANARLGVVHGFASVLGGTTAHPHGALCARLLPFVMDANIRAVDERGDPTIARRYIEIARTLTGDAEADAQDGVSWVRGLCALMKIPPLRVAGLSIDDCVRLIPLVQRASSTQGNPVNLSDDELRGILEASL
jgi:alcohol dehydrogenase class IV